MIDMPSIRSIALLILGSVALSRSHFILQIPESLGFDDDMEMMEPCGGFNATSRAVVTNWPVSGGVMSLLAAHDKSTFQIQAALLSNLNQWVPLSHNVSLTGGGSFCEPHVAGIKDWVGKDAVLRVVMQADEEEGTMYQCAAITFKDGNPQSLPSDCKNATGIIATWL